MLFLFWVFLTLESPIIRLLKYIVVIFCLYSIWGEIKSFELINAFKHILIMIVLFVPPLFLKDNSTEKKKC
ncbi:TPA: hypothetical protein I9063_002969 [Clostridium perfringens]|uniref:Uncharacterized protein n=2 Tax=Clostridium perfringens TaxID=1502 RepID=A0AAN5NDR9_CLOPF|nr:hypothetical protein [Clostridium perfringens]MBO3399371.1 hypothetical protein [Clostridium perfringens]MBO3408356.1 hypothetical protein [Clostridium perfringens]PWX29401.1 hypothetical protein CYK93_14665 [Clostridium perfringens]HAT4299565.1 hypothetical protein [Clostridium perfringens]